MRVRGFIHALRALGPRLSEIVLTGGWAWYLYRKYLTGEQGLPGEFTQDVDLVLPRPFSSEGSRLDDLLAAADFELEMTGEQRPPVTKHMWPSVDKAEAEVEFLTPARGSGEIATLEVSGVVAQQLRFLDLLLDEPISIEVNESSVSESFEGPVRVPRVGLFVCHKALTFERRVDQNKRYKDLFYIFDLVDETRGLQSTIEKDVRSYADSRGSNRLDAAAMNLARECGGPESDAIGRVVEQISVEQRPPRRYVAETFAQLIRLLKAQSARS